MSRRAKITKRTIDAIVPPASGEINLWDSEVPGFGLRVRYTGSRVYVVEYRNRAQRKRRVTLGPHGRLTVDQARNLARQVLAAVARGEDPAEERQESRSAPSFDELANRYLEQHAALKKKPADRALAVLSKMFSLAERWDLRPPGSNPCHGIDRYPERRRERFLSAEELARLGAVLEEEEPQDAPSTARSAARLSPAGGSTG